MSTLLQKLSSNSKEDVIETIGILRKRYIDMCFHPQDELNADFVEIFDFINRTNTNGNKNSEMARLLVALSALFLFPKPEQFGDLPFDSEDRFLLSLLILMHNMKGDMSQHNDICIDYVYQTLDAIGSSTSKSFYSMEIPFFTRYFAKSIKQLETTEKGTEIVTKFSEMISKVSPEFIGMDDLLFIPQILVADQFLKVIKTQQLADQFTQAVDHLFASCQNHPSALILVLFQSWFHLTKISSEDKNKDSVMLNFYDQVELITKYAERLPLSKHHELHHQFQWYLLFFFYFFVKDTNARTRLLIFICQGLKTVEQIENHRRVCETVEKFNETVLTQYDTHVKWPLFFFISNLQSNFTLYFQTVKTIYGIYLSPSITAEKENSFRKVRYGFSMQTYMQTTDVFVDNYLYTLIKERQTSSLETAMQWFNEEIDILTKMTEKTMSFLPFHNNFSKHLTENALTTKDCQSELYYFIKSAQIWTKFCVNICQKLTELKSFEFNHVLFKKDDLGKMITESRLTTLIDTIDKIHKSFITVILKTPPDYVNDVCDKISEILIHFIEKDKISMLFFDVFQPIRQSHSFIRAIIKCLYAYVSENIKLMQSDDRLDASAIPKVLAFCVRFCHRKDGDYHPQLLRQIKSFQRFLLTSIFATIRRSANQFDIFNAVKTDTLVFNTLMEKKEGKIPTDTIFSRLKPLSFFDMIDANKFAALPVFLELLAMDQEKNPLMSTLDVFKVCFQSSDSKLISKAAKMFSEMFSKEYPEGKVDIDNPLFVETASAMINDLNLVSKDAAKAVELIIPYIPHIYTRPMEPLTKICGIKYGDVDMLVLTKTIVANYVDSEQNAFFTFQYVTRCFDILKYRTLDFNHQNDLIQNLLGLLMKCIVYSRFENDLDKFYGNLVFIAGNLMAKSVSCVIFTEICALAATSRSQISAIMFRLADSILNYVATHNCNELFMIRTLNEIFAKSNPNRLHLLTIILVLYNKYFRHLITIDIIKLFLYEANTFIALDSEYSSCVSNFFKQYLSTANEEMKNKFIDLVYEVMSTRPIIFPHVLCKRVRKLGIHRPDKFIPLSNINVDWCDTFVSTDENVRDIISSQVFTLQLSLGTPIKPDDSFIIADRIKAFANKLIPQERLLRKNTLITELIKRKEFYDLVNVSNGNQSTIKLPQNVIFILCNTMTSRIPYLCNSATRKFKEFAENKDKCNLCAETIEGYCSKPATLIGQVYQEGNGANGGEEGSKMGNKYVANCCFYRRLIKLHPKQIPASVIQTLLKYYFDFETFSDYNRMINLPNFVQVVKTLTVQSFVMREDVRNIILDQSQKPSNLEKFIMTTMNLFSSKQVPYRAIILKYVWKFLSCFAPQTINIFFNTNLGNPITVYAILTDCIVLNPTNELFLAMKDYLFKDKRYSQLHPSVCGMIYELTYYKRLVTSDIFASLIKNMFSKMLAEIQNHDAKNLAENSFVNLEEIANSYIKIIEANATFESIIDFARLFQSAMFFHTKTYYEFIRVCFEGLPPDFWASFLDYIISGGIPLSNTQYYILVSHAILHCGDVKPEFIQKIWVALFNKLETESDCLCTCLRCFLSLLKRNQPRTSNAQRLNKVVIMGMKSGDPQTELYALKTTIKLNSYGLLPDFVFYSIGAQLLSYSKYFDDPYKNLYYEFFNMRPELYQSPPHEFIQALVYFTHDKCSTSRDTLILVEVFQNIPGLLNLLPFSVIASLVLFIKKNLLKLSKLRISEMNEFDGLFNACLRFVKKTKPSEREITLFVNIGCVFAQKVLEPLLGLDEPIRSVSEFLKGLFAFICEERPDLFPESIFDVICNNIFSPNSLFIVAAACKLKRPELVEKDVMIQKSLQLFCEITIQPDLPCYDDIFTYIVENGTPAMIGYLQQAYDWACKNFNITIRDRIVRICRAILRITPPFERFDKMKEIWETIVVRILKSNPFRCICHKLWMSFYLLFLEELPQAHLIDCIDFVMDNISDKPVTSSYLCDIAYCVAQLKIPVEIKLHFYRKIVWVIDFEARDSVPFMISEVLKIAKANQAFLPICIETMIILASINTPKMRISNFREILALLPADPKDRLQFLIEKIDPNLWNDMYLPIMALLACEESTEALTLLGFTPMVTKIGSHIMYGILCRFIDSGRNQAIISTFADRIKSVKGKRMHNEVLVALSASIISRRLPIHPVTLIKLAHDCGLHTAVESVNKDTAIPDRKFQTLLPFDTFYAYSHKYIAQNDAAAAALTMLGKYETAVNIFSEPLSTEPKFVTLMRELALHMRVTSTNIMQPDEFLFKCSWRFKFQSDELGMFTLALLLPADKVDQNKRLSYYNSLLTACGIQIRNKKESTIYVKQRIAIALSAAKFSDELLKKNTFDLATPNIVKSLDPSFAQSFRIAMSPPFLAPLEVDTRDPNPMFLISPKSRLFSVGAGIHKTGLVAVSKASVEEFFSFVMNQGNKLDADNWAKSATMLYNLCAINFSHELLTSALGAYCHVIYYNNELPPDRKFEALARLIILIREARMQNYGESMLSFMNQQRLFTKDNNKLFESLLAPLSKLCEDDFFMHIAQPIIEENISAVAGIAMSLGLTSLVSKCNELKRGVIESHQQLHEILGELFNVDIRSRDRQRRALQLILLMRSMSSAEVQSAANVTERSAIQDNIAKVIADSGIALKTTDSLLELKARVEKSDAITLAQEIVKTEKSIPEIDSEVTLLIKRANELITNTEFHSIDILMLTNEILWLGDCTLQIKCLTRDGQAKYLLITKIEGFPHYGSIVASDAHSALHAIANYNFQMHSRQFPTSSVARTIFTGQFAISLLHERVMTLRLAYDNTFNSDPSITPLQHDGCSLLRHVIQSATPVGYLHHRQSYISAIAFASASAILLRSSYPGLDDFVISPYSGSIVPHVSALEQVASFRLSPNVVRLCGYNPPGVITLSLAAAATSFVQSYETVCAIAEVMSDKTTMEEAIADRDNQVEHILNIAPVDCPAIGREETIQWHKDIIRVIDEAMTEKGQPATAIPWF